MKKGATQSSRFQKKKRPQMDPWDACRRADGHRWAQMGGQVAGCAGDVGGAVRTIRGVRMRQPLLSCTHSCLVELALSARHRILQGARHSATATAPLPCWLGR